MQKKTYKRIISGVLASLFTAQMLVLGDAGNNGLISAENIQALGNVIEQHVNSEKLKAEYDEAIEGLGEVDYFELPNLSQMKATTFSKQVEATDELSFPSTLTVSGYVQKGTVPGYTATDDTPITAYIFNEDFSVVLDSYSFYEGESYQVSAEIGNEANVKIECDGYLPFFLKKFGSGDYVIGSGDSVDTVTLIPGDTKHNDTFNNQWSDDVLDSNDALFVKSCENAYVGDEEFNYALDMDSDNQITAQDIADVTEDYTTYSGTDVSIYSVLDINHDGLINEYDDIWFDYYYGWLYSETENAEFSYWDVDADGYVSDADINAYFNSLDANEDYWMYMLDLNGDYIINSDDIPYLSSYIGLRGVSENYYYYMDKNSNGTIDNYDIAWFEQAYEQAYQTYSYCEAERAYKKSLTLFDNGYFSTSLNLQDTNLDLNGNALHIADCMSFTTDVPVFWPAGQGAYLDINGGYLYVGNNFVFRTASPDGWDSNTGQTLNMNGGSIVIGNEFHFGQPNCYDTLIMTNANDYLEINGNWNYVTSASMVDLWTAGFIGFYGPTWQVNEASGPYSIYSSHDHVIEFGYEYGQQVIRWDNQKDFWYETDRMLNFGIEIDEEGNEIPVNYGMSFMYDYTPENYYFRPELPFAMPEPDYTLYRKGWEMGDGVHIATGNYSKSFTDLSISSPGVKSDFIRTYNSMNTEEGSFGIGWDFNIDVSKIIIPAQGYYQAVLPDGSNTTFKDDGNGGFKCLNARSTMTKVNNEYTVTNAAQSQYHFNANGELDWVKDANENVLTISAMENNVRTVTDSTGRTYEITYNGNEEHLRVIKIKDIVVDRTVTYQYNSDFKLISATSVSGGIEYYNYDENGRLSKITNCYNEVTDEINYLPHGAVNDLINSAGLKQVYTYDKARKQTGLQEFDGDKLVKTFDYGYDEKYAIKTNTVTADGQTYEVDKITYNMVDGENKYDEMSESVDIMGNTTKYDRDGNGNVKKTTNPDGTYTLARYNDKNSITAQIDEQGYAVINAYDENGTRIIKSAKSINPISQDDIDEINLLNFNPVIYLTANESSYAITSYEYYADSYVSGIIGLVKKTTDPEGNVTEYDYYQSGVGKGLPKEVWVYGNGVSKPVNGTRYEYNAQLQVSKEISSEGYIKEYEYDKFNNVTKVKDYGAGSNPAISIAEYDLLSRKTAEYSPNYSADKSHGTLNTYYPSGSVKTQTDALGNVTTLEYNAYGNATKKTNPDGTINITEYDGLQREKATYFKSSENGIKQILTTTSYEFVENQSFDVYSSLDSKTSKSCNALKTTKLSYITNDNQIKTEVLADFRGNTVTEKIEEQLKRTNAYYANGQLARSTDTLGNATKYEYGYLGSLTKTYTPFNNVGSPGDYSITETQYNKNGQVILTRQTVQEQNSSDVKYSVTQNEYNALGLLTKVVLSDGTPNGEKNITKYFYNNDGIQTKMYTGMSSENDTTYLVTEYEYDSWMRAIRTTDSTGYNSGTITYDLNGNVLTSTDANGNITTNTYDALNRVIETNAVHPTDVSKNVSKSFTYDNMGRVSKTVHNGETISYEYDGLGRIVKENGSTFKGYFYVGVSQNVDSSIVGVNHLLMYSNTSYEYDDEMRVVKVKEGGEFTASYTYDANGNKASETLANGVVSTYIYNNANRIISISTTKDNVNISSHEYSYYLDGSDACKTRTENGIIEETSYEYDGLKRLTEEAVSVGNTTVDTYSYEYDDYGNRSKMTATGSENYITEYDYTDDNGNYTTLLQKETKTIEVADSEDSFTGLVSSPTERLNNLNSTSNVKETVYTYDENGSQITKATDEKTETNTYNAVNQLVGFTDGETTASYTYNADGLRASKTVDGDTIKHVWDGAKQIIADVKNGAFYQADCYIRGTSLVAKYSYVNGTKSEYTYYTQNAHGDVINLTDTNGAVTKTYKYDAFGVEKNIDDADTNAFRYCGEYYDSETGTIYLRARHYNPSNGRFTQRDSFAGKQGDPLSLNLYTYCHNNPIVGIDPTGHSFWDKIFNFMEVEAPTIKTNYVIYASYNGDKNNKKQAEIIKEQYKKTYGDSCRIYSVESAEEFVNTWNSLDDSYGIDAIHVISHGSVNDIENSDDYGIGHLNFKDSALYSSSFEGLTGGDRSINDVQSKNVGSIYFSACNTANLDFKKNIAEAFYDKNTSARSVSGWDGGVTFRFHQRGPKSIFSGNFKFKAVNKDVPSASQRTFKNFMDKTGNTRDPGLIEFKRP